MQVRTLVPLNRSWSLQIVKHGYIFRQHVRNPFPLSALKVGSVPRNQQVISEIPTSEYR